MPAVDEEISEELLEDLSEDSDSTPEWLHAVHFDLFFCNTIFDEKVITVCGTICDREDYVIKDPDKYPQCPICWTSPATCARCGMELV